VDGNLILCRTRLEEAEQYLRELVASLPAEEESRLRAAEALVHILKAIEVLRVEEPGKSYRP